MPAPDQLVRQKPTTISIGAFDPALPYFAYGSLRTDGLAYPKIEPYVAEARPFGVTGILCVRDGLPTLVNEWRDGRGCWGDLLTFGPGAHEAYEEIAAFEPAEHYEWTVLETPDGTRFNCLVAKVPDDRALIPLDESRWELQRDGMFTHGLAEVGYALRDLLSSQLGSERKLYKGQMAYLMLWTVLERLSKFVSSSRWSPSERALREQSLRAGETLGNKGVSAYVSDLGRSKFFAQALLSRIPSDINGHTIRRADNPQKVAALHRTNAVTCIKYYYQLRSNIAHQGKAAIQDRHKLESALRVLYFATTEFLGQKPVVPEDRLPTNFG